MSYTVIWLESAESELADIWLNASNRHHFTTAAHEIDIRLRTNPEIEGESRSAANQPVACPVVSVSRDLDLVAIPDSTKIRIWKMGECRVSVA